MPKYKKPTPSATSVEIISDCFTKTTSPYTLMGSPSVEIISDCFIKPNSISEQSEKPIYFSPWDLLMISVNYIQKGLLFRLPNDQNFNMNTLLQDLKDSLSITLTHFHPLAARLTTVKKQNPPSLVVFMSHENSPGARFIHAKVTELKDGVFIGCSINHMVVDGSSYWHFFNSWSEVFNSKGQNGKYSSVAPISRPPVIERWTPPGCGPILTLPFTREDEFIDRPYPPLLRERIFHISADSVAKLKAKVNSECNTTKISSLQSLSAVVWRCVTRARRVSKDHETGCRLAINNRGRLSPPFSENYFGNCIQAIKSLTTAGELLDQSVGWAARILHESVLNHGDKEIRDYMDSWVKSPYVYKMNLFFDGSSIQMGSSPRFNMYGNEFGLGKGLAVLSGYANKFDGKVTLYEGREGGGSMDLEVCMLPENMDCFECDEEFMSLVDEKKAI
nr:uncharacterized acetyltransferase At3g50280-like [Tanacetum cinerariifolium]